MNIDKKRNLALLILSGFFVTNAVVAEMIGGKLIYVGSNLMSIGILPWPVVFLVTDIINEFYGKKTVRKLSFITAGLISYCFVLLLIAINVPAASGNGFITDEQFNAVFGQSNLIIIGSIIAFLVGQLLDATLFHFIKEKTGDRFIWLRSTGSTVVSQFVDTFIVLGIAFYLPQKISFSQYIASGFTGYSVKLGIAILLTPVIYLLHHLLKKYLAREN
jgi:queuosine precursor transporter